ncbi:MAG: TonB-dependent receptor, partial [Moorella sp. (in: Bacteria)]|nr:TonB-dependent receptor [Moorella sp. (in: firmicutes)]
TADPRRPGETGSPLASWLLDVPFRSEKRDYYKRTRFGGVASLYFQDSWRVTPRLTLNFGLRYDYTRIPPIGKQSDGTIYTGNLDLIRGVYWLQKAPPPCAESGGVPCLPSPSGALPEHVSLAPGGRLLSDYKDNWQPRLGLAYRLNTRTVARASFGIFFDSWPSVIQAVQNLGHNWPDVGQRLV